MKKTERAQIINLLNVPKIGPQRVRNLLAHFEHGENVFNASKKELCQRSGVDIGLAEAILKYKDFGFGLEQIEKAEKKNVTIYTIWDEDYPLLLKKIYDPPVLLYTIGQPLKKEEDAVAIVGTRKLTPYGRSMTKAITADMNSADHSCERPGTGYRYHSP